MPTLVASVQKWNRCKTREEGNRRKGINSFSDCMVQAATWWITDHWLLKSFQHNLWNELKGWVHTSPSFLESHYISWQLWVALGFLTRATHRAAKSKPPTLRLATNILRRVFSVWTWYRFTIACHVKNRSGMHILVPRLLPSAHIIYNSVSTHKLVWKMACSNSLQSMLWILLPPFQTAVGTAGANHQNSWSLPNCGYQQHC